MRTSTLRPAALLALAAVSLPAIAHEDDPKLLDRVPPVTGPGFRAQEDRGASLESLGFSAAGGITLRSWLPLNQLDNANSGNDCWGYVSPSGREYALIGTSSSTVFVEVTNPESPQVIEVIAGPGSLWRDVKTYQNYAYSVSEGGGGIQVMSLANIDS